jgi:uncharacterized protein
MTVDCKGDIYPCLRFLEYSLAYRKGWPIGNVFDGMKETVRPFHCLRKSLMSSEKCMECDMNASCSWCLGYNYDVADTDTLFQRATAICEMHKSRYRANQYYWKLLKDKHGIDPSQQESFYQTPIGCLV